MVRLLTPESAVRSKILETQQAYGDFLRELEGGGNGFLFRHGWVVRLLLGLLQTDPNKRLTVNQAYGMYAAPQTPIPNLCLLAVLKDQRSRPRAPQCTLGARW